jgi:peptide-methionine (S)-S-oxide reductase
MNAHQDMTMLDRRRWMTAGGAIASATIVLYTLFASAAEETVLAPPPTFDAPKTAGEMQTAVLAGGCFWGVEGVYEHVRGVQSVQSGYSGGTKSDAHYETVSGGDTGHAESVRIVFDPAQISYGEILQIFFSVVHDPTQLNKQGPDHGKQYRSNIFYADDMQQEIATKYIAQLEAAKIYSAPIVTRLDPLKAFYPAEGYHQNFLEKNPTYPYIVYNDLPKIEHLRKEFPEMLKKK